MSPWIAACKIDLKGFDDQRYRTLGGVLAKVTQGIRRVHERGLWLEVVTLLVPGFNDGEAELRALTRFLASVSPDIPWHVTAFHPDYQMTGPPATTARQLVRAAEIGRERACILSMPAICPAGSGPGKTRFARTAGKRSLPAPGIACRTIKLPAPANARNAGAQFPASGRPAAARMSARPRPAGRGGCRFESLMNRSANEFAQVRPPAVAGEFYPRPPDELRRLVADFLRQVPPGDAPAPKAIIVPHAGYVFSGPVAASAYARLAPARAAIQRVVLVGPSHYLPFVGLAAAGAEAFTTPLGLVPVDTEAVRQACRLRQVSVLDEAHAREHSLEVQLPFLQTVLDDFKIVPLLTGDVTDAQVAEVITALWGGPETCFVISSDLSHYCSYAVARELDLATSRAIEHLRPGRVAETQACGHIAICGLLRAALQHHLHARTVDLRNSGDTAGPRHEVVGYGAFVFEERG